MLSSSTITSHMVDSLKSQETAIDKLEAKTLIPLSKIESIFGAQINHRTQPSQNSNKFDNQCQLLASIYQLLRLGEEGHVPMQSLAKYAPAMQLPSYSRLQQAFTDNGLDTPVYSQTTFTGLYSNKEVYNLHLAHFSNEELHLGDITLQNVRYLLPSAQAQHFRTQHPGIRHGVFDEILKNLAEFAKQEGYKKISLSAVDMLRVQTFGKRGFKPRPGILLQAGLQTGFSIPMVREL